MGCIVIIGAGAMGLAAAYHAAKAGHDVEVIEAAPIPGGMAAHFDLDGTSIERFYHFVCKSDGPTFALLAELGISDRLRWRPTSMGYFVGGKLYDWGTPLALLRFDQISLFSRFRYGLFAFVSTRREKWDSLETETAQSWITRWCGREVYDKLWKPLFDLKFYEYADNISASWIWTRVKRIGRSRKSMFQEELGFIEGGSKTLVDALCKGIELHGGRIRLGSRAERIHQANGRVTGVATGSGFIPADEVISTAPVQLIASLAPDLPIEWLEKYNAIPNIGVCCLVFKLKKSVSRHFWINIPDPEGPIPGLIEFSNLRPVDGTIVYVPYYMPITNPKFNWADCKLIDEAFQVLMKVNPGLTKDDIISAHVSRLRHAQPICAPGFAAKIPGIKTPIGGLQIADTCFYYPEDRGISESVRVGRDMAAQVGELASSETARAI